MAKILAKKGAFWLF